MQLSETQIDLWFANDEDFAFDELASVTLEWLTEKEVKRFERFCFSRHRKELLLGKALIRIVLSNYYDRDPGEWVFSENEFGKPMLAPDHDEAIHFNLSHSGDRLVLAVSRHEFLGIDIERSNRQRRVARIADRYFTAQELEPLVQLAGSAQQDRFYDLWTLKEAYIKARGMGLALSLKQFGFIFEDKERIRLQLDPAMDDDLVGWQYWQLDAGQDYSLAMAVKTKDVIAEFNSYQVCSLREYEPIATSIRRRFVDS